MTGDLIKSFLVGLGFGVDDASLAKFNKAIASASLRVAALYGSIKIMAAGVVYGLSKVSESFEQLGYEYRIIAPAINKTLMLRRELLKAYRAAGIDITKVIQDSVKLNFSLAKTRFAFEAIYRSVASRFFQTLTKQSDLFRKQIYANMPKIQAILERMVKFIFKALEATTALGIRLWSILTRVYDFFSKLDKATDGWSTIILGVVAAWKLLNLSFIATPLGAIITGLLAILALFDDFKTWQEGGAALFDWSSFIPTIDAAVKAISAAKTALGDLFQILFAVVDAFVRLFHLDFSGFADRMKAAFSSTIDYIKDVVAWLKSLVSVGGALGNWGSQFFGNGNVAANVQNAPTGAGAVRPIGNNVQNAQTNQNVQQQTNINVMGSADANAVGKAVSGEQSKVNFDMVRNMKGATR